MHDALNDFPEEEEKKSKLSVLLSKKEKVEAKEPTLSHIKETFCKEVKDASYKIENRRLTIEEETIGVSLNDEEASKILSQEKGDIILIPVKVTMPKVTTETIKAELFPDLLATYSSRYDAKNVSRSHNVALASKFINEIVLAPGDIFSYNDVVGPRTAERGFREAGVYVGNKVEQGIGGGICQVSSTLFNTAVLSDLKIVYRINHSLPVS